MIELLGRPRVLEYNGLHMNELPLNHAYVIANSTYQDVGIYSVPDDCYHCPLALSQRLTFGNGDVSWKIDTSVQRTWRAMNFGDAKSIARNFRSGLLCEMRPQVHEFGVYRLKVGRCEMRAEVDPTKHYYPLLFCGVILLVIYLLSLFTNYYTMKVKSKNDDEILEENIKANEKMEEGSKSDGEEARARVVSDRILSLDFYRGFLFIFLVFSTTGGAGYPVFNRKWFDTSIADIIVFIYSWTIGFYIPKSISCALEKGQKRWTIFGNIFKRGLALVLLGTVIDCTIYIPFYWSKTEHITVWCPLQKLGFAYFFGAVTYFLTAKEFGFKSKKFIKKLIGNILNLMWCWLIGIVVLALLIVSIFISYSFNCQTDISMNADRIIDLEDLMMNCDTNVTDIFNQIMIGKSTPLFYVNSFYAFSGGLMGVLSTILSVMIGLQAGAIYINFEKHSDRLNLWYVCTILYAICGCLFAYLTYPTQFNLWPVSTVLTVSALALWIYTLTYRMIEMKLMPTSIYAAPGATFLVLLPGHLLFSHSLPFDWGLEYRDHFTFALQNIWIITLWVAIALVFNRKDIKLAI